MNQEIQKKDNVNHPGHYAGQGKVECIDFIASVVNKYPGILAGDLQNVCKYTWRSHNKNGKEDIDKASWYFNHAEKTYDSLMPEVRKQVQAFTQYPLFQIPNKDKVQQEGMAEVTKGMDLQEKELYQRIMAGVNHFTDDYLRKRAKTALQEWSQSYENFQEMKLNAQKNPLEKQEKASKPKIIIHRVRSNKGLER